MTSFYIDQYNLWARNYIVSLAFDYLNRTSEVKQIFLYIYFQVEETGPTPGDAWGQHDAMVTRGLCKGSFFLMALTLTPWPPPLNSATYPNFPRFWKGVWGSRGSLSSRQAQTPRPWSWFESQVPPPPAPLEHNGCWNFAVWIIFKFFP